MLCPAVSAGICIEIAGLTGIDTAVQNRIRYGTVSYPIEEM